MLKSSDFNSVNADVMRADGFRTVANREKL
jgi:hypothetical protein